MASIHDQTTLRAAFNLPKAKSISILTERMVIDPPLHEVGYQNTKVSGGTLYFVHFCTH